MAWRLVWQGRGGKLREIVRAADASPLRVRGLLVLLPPHESGSYGGARSGRGPAQRLPGAARRWSTFTVVMYATTARSKRQPMSWPPNALDDCRCCAVLPIGSLPFRKDHAVAVAGGGPPNRASSQPAATAASGAPYTTSLDAYSRDELVRRVGRLVVQGRSLAPILRTAA